MKGYLYLKSKPATTNDHGFVRAIVMEGMIVVAIVAIIAAIAIPQYMNYKNRPFNEEARAHAFQAYEASRAFFRANPKGQPMEKDIEQFGYRSNPDILLMIEGGKENLFIRATHMKAQKTYKINAQGELLD